MSPRVCLKREYKPHAYRVVEQWGEGRAVLVYAKTATQAGSLGASYFDVQFSDVSADRLPKLDSRAEKLGVMIDESIEGMRQAGFFPLDEPSDKECVKCELHGFGDRRFIPCNVCGQCPECGCDQLSHAQKLLAEHSKALFVAKEHVWSGVEPIEAHVILLSQALVALAATIEKKEL